MAASAERGGRGKIRAEKLTDTGNKLVAAIAERGGRPKIRAEKLYG